MLTSTGFVISIALAIGLMTTAMDPDVMVAVFSGTQVGSEGIDLDPFIQALHVAFAAGVVASFVGAVVSWGRGAEPGEPSLALAMEVGAESVVEDAEAGASI
jgi:hypothetical protein